MFENIFIHENQNICRIDLDYAEQIAENAMFGAYSVIAWIAFGLGTPGHLLLLLAFYKQYKEEKAYMYQVFATLSESLEMLAYVQFTICIKLLSGAEYSDGYLWYKKFYPLMWYTGHVVHGIYALFFTLSLLLSVCMVADRVFALVKPFTYKNIDQKKHQIIALSICFLISLNVCYVEGFVFSVITNDDHYEIVILQANIEYLYTVVLGHLRNIVRLLAMLTLMILNLILVHMYNRRNKQVAHLVSSSQNNDQEKERKRKEQERILHMLTICQSFFQFLSVMAESGFYSFLYGWAWFGMCVRHVGAPIMDAVVSLCDLGELYTTFLINKQFRRMVFESLPCSKKKQNTIAGTGQLEAPQVATTEPVVVIAAGNNI